MFTKEYLLGIFFIVLVALIWAASSVVAQFVYQTDSFDSPFLLTYIGTSLFTLWLPVRFSSKWLSISVSGSGGAQNDEGDVLLAEPSYHQTDDIAEQAVHALQTTESSPHVSSSRSGIEGGPIPQSAPNLELWTDDDHFRVALRIAPVWFVANWSYNASLLYTSITSSTVLASTSSLFTFLFAVLVKDESFSCIRLAGVLLGVSGGILTALHDASDDRRHLLRWLSEDQDEKLGDGDAAADALALLGDFLGLISAIGYGAYAVQTRVYCPKDESLYSMQLLLGYIGLLNMTILSPVALYVALSAGKMQWLVVGCVLLKGLFDNFLRYAGPSIILR